MFSWAGVVYGLSELCRSTSTYNTMNKLIYTLVCMLMLYAVSIPFAAARDAKRDALQQKLMQQQRQQQRWEAVMNSTGAARLEALKIYQNYLHNLWDPPPQSTTEADRTMIKC
jgi:hypothetical protein